MYKIFHLNGGSFVRIGALFLSMCTHHRINKELVDVFSKIFLYSNQKQHIFAFNFNRHLIGDTKCYSVSLCVLHFRVLYKVWEPKNNWLFSVEFDVFSIFALSRRLRKKYILRILIFRKNILCTTFKYKTVFRLPSQNFYF